MALPRLLVGRLSHRDRLLDPTGLRCGRQSMWAGLLAIPRHVLLPLLAAEGLHSRPLVVPVLSGRRGQLHTMDPDPDSAHLVFESLLGRCRQ